MHPQLVIASFSPGLLAAAGTTPGRLSEGEWVARVIHEIGRSQIKEVILETLKGTALGALAGVVLAIVAFWAFRRLGWYDSSWRFARALRAALLTLTLMIAGVLCGTAGFWWGLVRGAEPLLAKSQLGTELLPHLGNVIADGMAWLQLRTASPETNTAEQVSAKLEAFRAGDWELDAAAFVGQLDRFQAETVREALADLERSALEQTPQLKGGLGERLIHQFLTGFGAALAEKKATRRLRGWGVDRLLTTIRDRLPAEAAKSGNPQTIARTELATFVVQEGVAPGILIPIRSFARSQQVALVCLALALVLIPPVALRLFRRSTPPPARSGAGVQAR